MQISNIFFFGKWIDKVVFASFWWVILMAIVFWLPFTRPWWWVFFPFFLSIELRKLYIWWIRWDFYYAKIKWITLEMIPPKEILVPLKAMEDVFSVMWGPLFDGCNWREKWFEGELTDAPFWMSWEIASMEGTLHYYVRIMAQHRAALESALYSHYPDLEIHETADYMKDVPQNVPNDEWGVYGEDFILGKEDPYPIKTFEKFFEPQGERISAEEKRIDPIGSLLEMMARLGPGEHYWLQFITMGTADNYEPSFRKEAEKIINKLTNRAVKQKTTWFDDVMKTIGEIIFGPKKEGSGEKATYKWISSSDDEREGEREMVLTPGEREIVTEIENKLKRPIFRTTLRGVYVAKRENWHTSNGKVARAFFSHFQTLNLNHIRFTTSTRPKTHYVFRKRIPFLRARRMFRNTVLRYPPMFQDRSSETVILNTEELATLYHFPLKISGVVLPTLPRVESKKAGPPQNLPIE